MKEIQKEKREREKKEAGPGRSRSRGSRDQARGSVDGRSADSKATQ